MYLYLKWKSQKGMYLKSICKYNQIHIKLPTKGKALPDINWLRSLDRMFFTPVVWSTVGRQHLRKLAYSEDGQTLASMNEWEASEAYL